MVQGFIGTTLLVHVSAFTGSRVTAKPDKGWLSRVLDLGVYHFTGTKELPSGLGMTYCLTGWSSTIPTIIDQCSGSERTLLSLGSTFCLVPLMVAMASAVYMAIPPTLCKNSLYLDLCSLLTTRPINQFA